MQRGVLCADIGTSSLKAAFITEDGTVLKFIRLLFPQPVQAVDWVQTFFAAWHILPADYVIEAICVSGNGPSLVAVPQNRRVPEANINSAGRAPKIHINVDRHLFAASLPPDDVMNGIIDAAKNDTLLLWNEPMPQGLPVSGQQGATVPAP